jgi:hypothetical protein
MLPAPLSPFGGDPVPIAVDQEGNIFAALELFEESQDGGPVDAFAWGAMLDSEGRPVWSRTFGVSGGSYPISIAIDPCASELFLGGTVGTYPKGSSVAFDTIDGGGLLLGPVDNSSDLEIDMFLARLAR